MQHLGVMLSVFPTALLMQRFGRGMGFRVGSTTGMVGASICAWGLVQGSILIMCVGGLIQGYAVAMTLETTEQELMETIFPHPTLSEMMHEAVLDAYGRVLHV